MSSADRLVDEFEEPLKDIQEARYPCTATVVTFDSGTTNTTFTVPSFDGGFKVFGPSQWSIPAGASPAAGDTILVVQDEFDNYWIISP